MLLFSAHTHCIIISIITGFPYAGETSYGKMISYDFLFSCIQVIFRFLLSNQFSILLISEDNIVKDPKIVCFFCYRILENNNIHQITSMTFSGLNSLVLL